MSKYLSFYGGDRAISIIREHGLTQDIVKVVAGAAGGPKWIILGAMDRFLFSEWFTKRSPSTAKPPSTEQPPSTKKASSGSSRSEQALSGSGNIDPLFLAGSSAGAWRFAAASQSDPAKSLERLAQFYIHQWYSIKPELEEIDVECWKVLNGFIDDNSVNDILNHPYCRLSFFSVRSKWGAASDNPLLLTTTMIGAALSNAFNRKYLKHFFERTLFYHPLDKPPFYNMDQYERSGQLNGCNRTSWFPMLKVVLNHENFKKAL
ncbi:MAG: hypothetical protein HQK62_11410, partial [Desulfamplus sp.]|nr:hypothetical protein [Desulfamplus sp.]